MFNEDIAFRLSFEHCARHVEEAAGLSLDGVRSYFRTEQERQVGSLEHVGSSSGRNWFLPFISLPINSRAWSLSLFRYSLVANGTCHPTRVRFHSVEP